MRKSDIVPPPMPAATVNAQDVNEAPLNRNQIRGFWAVFAVGGLRALLLAAVRHGVTEPSRWKAKERVVHSWAIWRPFAALFSKALRRRTILNALFVFVSICGLWAGTVYVPSAVTILAEAAGRVGPAAAQLASRATMLVAFATIIGCLLMPW